MNLKRVHRHGLGPSDLGRDQRVKESDNGGLGAAFFFREVLIVITGAQQVNTECRW